MLVSNWVGFFFPAQTQWRVWYFWHPRQTMKGGTATRAWSLKRHLKRASSVFLRTHQRSAAAPRAPFHLREQNIHDPLRALTQSQADRNNCSVCLSLFGARFFFLLFFFSFTPSLLIFFTACKDVRVWCNIGCHSMNNCVSVCDLNLWPKLFFFHSIHYIDGVVKPKTIFEVSLVKPAQVSHWGGMHGLLPRPCELFAV